jgi:hypothetical protein
MGWMHDFLNYMSLDPIHRRFHQGEVTFSLVYAFHEHFVLVLSHDEVVHGKGSLINKMPGDVWQKFANLRCFMPGCTRTLAKSCSSWAANLASGASGITTNRSTGISATDLSTMASAASCNT